MLSSKLKFDSRRKFNEYLRLENAKTLTYNFHLLTIRMFEKQSTNIS